MGIESISGVSSFQSASTVHAAQPIQQVKVAEAPEAGKTTADIATAQSAAGQIPVATEAGKQSYGGDDSNPSGQGKEPTMKDVQNINKIINNNTVAEFGYNEPTKRITIKIKDKETDEVIKEIPSEKALEMLAKAWELAGIMVDEKR